MSKLRDETFYDQYHQHGGTTIIPTEIFNELYNDAKEEIERLNNNINKAIEFLNNECLYDEDLGYCDDLWCGIVQELVNILKGVDEE